MEVPSKEDFRQGYHAFQEHEKRDAMYKVASFLVNHFWGQTGEMADSLGVLLLTWNQAFYRYGPFDYDRLEECLSENLDLLNSYRNRSILSYTYQDDKYIRRLFRQIQGALQICEGSNRGHKSPVGSSKALHLLAPNFFPIWDDLISRAYDCYYGNTGFPEDKYITFLKRMKRFAQKLQPYIDEEQTDKTTLKLIDEYNYAKYTKSWI